jgi:crotonobetainyl-CoA:carnitine CoA-transferase CaiB-like acyl-CoA transferase
MMGPLAGVEIAGLGAAPDGCMMPADMGADVMRIERCLQRQGRHVGILAAVAQSPRRRARPEEADEHVTR